jgi:CRISPR-associated endonuclease/helicase Cas3
MMGDPNRLFQELDRVEIIDHTSGGRAMSMREIADLALAECCELGNCLVVVNTKKSAMELYRALATKRPGEVFHLSTDMCAHHRKRILSLVRKRLDLKRPVLCISTQLIEAGVDIDFRTVIRFLAGLDSIAQAAGRCNRNGMADKGHVHIVTPEAENLSSLPDLARGKECAARVLRDFAEAPDSLGGSLLHPLVMKRYFKYAFHDCRNDMAYPVDTGRNDTLLEILAENGLNGGHMPHPLMLRQSFMAAARAFQAIDAPTEGVIVPYGAGKKIIAELQAEITPEQRRALLRRAQRYSVNLFPNRKRILLGKGALQLIPEAEILVLDERHYSREFGLSDQPVEPLSFLEA